MTKIDGIKGQLGHTPRDFRQVTSGRASGHCQHPRVPGRDRCCQLSDSGPAAWENRMGLEEQGQSPAPSVVNRGSEVKELYCPRPACTYGKPRPPQLGPKKVPPPLLQASFPRDKRDLQAELLPTRGSLVNGQSHRENADKGVVSFSYTVGLAPGLSMVIRFPCPGAHAARSQKIKEHPCQTCPMQP